MTTPDQVRPFEKPYWNLFQTIAWIYVDDDYLIRLFDDDVTEYGSVELRVNFFSDEYGWPSIKTIFDYGKPHDKEKLKFPKFEDAENALINALANERLTCYGIVSNDDSSQSGNLKPMPHYLWSELGFIYAKDRIQAKKKKAAWHDDTPKWYNLKFKREEVEKLWPTDTRPGIQARNNNQESTKKKERIRAYSPRNALTIKMYEACKSFDNEKLRIAKHINVLNMIDDVSDLITDKKTDKQYYLYEDFDGNECQMSKDDLMDAFNKMKDSILNIEKG